MKKVVMLAVMVAGMTSYAVAQDANTLPEKSDKGQAVRTVAQGAETGKEKGKLVSETASQNGVETATAAKAKGEEETTPSEVDATANHGTDVKAVATDESLTGKEKGEAVKAVATSNEKARRSERVSRETARPARPERAKRPATAGRPSVPGRP